MPDRMIVQHAFCQLFRTSYLMNTSKIKEPAKFRRNRVKARQFNCDVCSQKLLNFCGEANGPSTAQFI